MSRDNKELVTGADFKILSGSGAPDKAKGSKGKALKVPTIKGTKKAPKLRTLTTKLKNAKVTKGRTMGGY